MNRNLILRITVIAAVATAFVTTFASTATQTAAQGTNLLVNPGMLKPYVGQGASDQTAPNGWSLWFTGSPVTSFPDNDIYGAYGGRQSWNIRRSWVAFTAGGYQQVSGIAIGSTIHATTWAQSYTCNDQVHSCIGADHKHHSDTTSGAVVRVGIDPSGGTNPSSGQIVWSPNVSAFDVWTNLTVDAINCNATVTIFLYTTQSAGMFINSVYFDNATLSVTQQGTGNVASCGPAPSSGNGTAATPKPPTAAYAPFVQKQNGVQPDGSIIHVVVAGDTLAGIAYAYGVTLDQLRQLNNLQPGYDILQIGQKITVRGPTPITPTPTFVPTKPVQVAPTVSVVIVGPTPTPTPVIEVF